MNTPGTREGNWQWRFTWEQVADDLPRRIRGLLAESERLPRPDASVQLAVPPAQAAGSEY